MNILSLTSGSLKNLVTTVSTSAMTFLQTTSTAVVIKVSSAAFSNNTTSFLQTATLQLVSGGVTHPLAIGMNVDPEQPPEHVITRQAPLYLTGTQALRGSASSTNVSLIVAYEELS